MQDNAIEFSILEWQKLVRSLMVHPQAIPISTDYSNLLVQIQSIS